MAAPLLLRSQGQGLGGLLCQPGLSHMAASCSLIPRSPPSSHLYEQEHPIRHGAGPGEQTLRGGGRQGLVRERKEGRVSDSGGARTACHTGQAPTPSPSCGARARPLPPTSPPISRDSACSLSNCFRRSGVNTWRHDNTCGRAASLAGHAGSRHFTAGQQAERGGGKRRSYVNL